VGRNRLALATEIAGGSTLKTDGLKDLVDGRGRMSARQIRQRHRSFERAHTLFVYGNHDPVEQSTDTGTWRRIIKIPFTRTFDEKERNDKLKERLIAEHLSEVLAWAVRGCLEWQRIGLAVPDVVKAATEAYRQEQDEIGHFLSERTRPCDGTGTSVNSVYGEFTAWRKEGGCGALSKRELGGELRRRGYDQNRTTVGGVNARFWVNLEIAAGPRRG